MALQENKNCYASQAQRELLINLIGQNILKSDFFLTGGTALSVFYLNHRISNDLDLFTITEIDLSEVAYSLRSLWKNAYIKIKESSTFLSLLIQDIKIDFVIDPLSLAEQREYYYLTPNRGLSIDTIRNISSNKLGALVGRTEPKDFIDFYFLLKSYQKPSLADIYEDAIKKDAIFEDPPTVAFQIEEGVSFLKKNPEIFPPVLIDFDPHDFFKFYQSLTSWIYLKI
ncbi:nucleotidyl transferase AbiEii/AbiGii toxin family protein [candidate division KSB1 bacterium]|nr:nucleotidyl transferase AbiEii/AbiGii toxin family protein [candidate division KSB1 bacterium]